MKLNASECSATGKLRFTKQSEANRAILHFKKKSRRTEIPRRAYFCRDCGGWHLTSEVKHGP